MGVSASVAPVSLAIAVMVVEADFDCVSVVFGNSLVGADIVVVVEIVVVAEIADLVEDVLETIAVEKLRRLMAAVY